MNSTIDWYGSTWLGEGIVSIRGSANAPPSHSFLVHSDREVVLIDTGRGVGDLLGYLETAFATPDHVLLTHSHWDHIGNAHQFESVFVHPQERSSDGRVTIDVLSDEFVDRPSTFAAGQRRNGTTLPREFDPDTFTCKPANDVREVSDGSTFDVGDRELEVFEIPGHSPGQIAILDGENGILFGADIIHVDRNIFAHFVDSSVDDYVDSLYKVVELRDSGAFDTLATAHNEPITGEELDILDDLLDRFEEISDGGIEFETVQTPWGDARRYLVGDSKILTNTRLG